jgi:hypothetical protein
MGLVTGLALGFVALPAAPVMATHLHGLPAKDKPAAGKAKVGRYLCPSLLTGPPTFVSILPGNKYLGPYTTKSSTPSKFRFATGAMYSGGKVMKLLDGPYAKMPTLALEYYPAGTNPYGTTPYAEPVIHIISVPEMYVQGCTWIRKNPFG